MIVPGTERAQFGQQGAVQFPSQGTATGPSIAAIVDAYRRAKQKGPSKKDALYGIISNSLGGLPIVGGIVGPQGLGRGFQSKEAGGLGWL